MLGFKLKEQLMTLVIENASEKFLPLFQEVAKLDKAKITIAEEDKDITQAIIERKSPKLKKFIREYEKDKRVKKLKTYTNFDAFLQDL